MGYEILIRKSRPDAPLPEAALAASLEEAARTGLPEPPPKESPAAPSPAAIPASAGAGPWSLANGKARVGARLAREDASLTGADFDVPFGGSEDELRRAFLFVAALAESTGAAVFDPQLGREVGRGAVEEVVARWRQSQSWMVDVAGTYEDSRSLAAIEPVPPLVSRRAKIILLLLGAFLAVYWLIGAVGAAFRAR